MQESAELGEEETGGERKWLCEYCTFENWPSSPKCTMCRGSRPLRVIATTQQNIYSSSQATHDIYRLSSPPLHSSPPPQLPDTDPSSGKWACQACTYYNYPKALRCTQCLTSRRKVSPAVSRASPGSPRGSPLPFPGAVTSANRANSLRSLATDQGALNRLADQLHPLHISVCQGNQAAAPPSPESSKELGMNSRNSPAPCNSSTSSNKWSCLVCTFENFPKAGACVLCGARKGRSSPEHLQTVQAESLARDSPSPEGASMRRRVPDAGNRSPENNRGRRIREENNRGLREAGDNRRREEVGSSSQASGSSERGEDNNNLEYEKRLRQLRRRMRETDWAWLSACMGVVEGDSNPVEAYLNGGGDPTRKLTNCEATLLGRPGVYEQGHTLVHLAVKLQREDLLATLLSQMDSFAAPVVKRVPSYVAPDLAAAIRRQVALGLRQRKGPVPCFYLSDCATYSLPPEVEDLPRATQEQLLDELLDRDAQAELETELVINWSVEVTAGLGTRLSALWNRSAGDCLLDAVLQASWGVFDRDNTLRRAISDSLQEAGHVFYPRWKEWEMRQAQELDFTLAESQWAEEWAALLALASQPGEALEQLHVFCLAHVLRRPICVYGVKYVKSWRGENLGLAKFEGVYLPLLWDRSFCYRSPLALGYTRGHFSALVPPEPEAACGGAGGGVAPEPRDQASRDCFLPLMTRDRSLLPVHFLTKAESGREEQMMRDWMDVLVTESGLLVAQQSISRPPLLVAQMTEEWLNYYRKIAQSSNPTQSRAGGQNNSMINCNLESSEESDE